MRDGHWKGGVGEWGGVEWIKSRYIDYVYGLGRILFLNCTEP